jgi:hypothetical protein
MEQRDTRSLQQIKLETEQTRASLTQTVEQLRATVAERINPDAIKGEVSQYVRSRGEQLLDDATAAVRRNPMQAVAVGASVAYPLLRLARAIPVPIWMVGAGLFLASSKTGQSVSQKAADAASDLSNSLMYRARDIRDQAADAADTAKSFASEKINRLTEAVTGGTKQPDSATETAGGFASEQFQDVATTPGAASSYRTPEMSERDARGAGIRDMAADAATASRRAVEASKNMGLHAAKTVQETASSFGERAGKTLFETVEQNPLLVAGVGLFVGGLIASALPRSDMENRVVGKASNSVKSRADEAAAGAVRAAKDAVGGAFEEATKQAEAEGLTPEGVAQTARDLGERLRHVAEAAVTTAFEPAQNGNEHQQRNTHGETDHG